MIGVYTVKYTDQNNKIQLENLGTIDKNDKNSITDQQLDTYEISKYVSGFVCKCNITHHYLMTTQKLPVAYINVCYTKYPLKVVLLYRIFLYFKIDSVEHIKKMEDLVEKDFNGKFVIDASINNQMIEIENIENGCNYNGQLNDKMVELTRSNDMMGLMKELINDVEEAMAIQYKDDEMFKMPDIASKRFNNNNNNNNNK